MLILLICIHKKRLEGKTLTEAVHKISKIMLSVLWKVRHRLITMRTCVGKKLFPAEGHLVTDWSTKGLNERTCEWAVGRTNEWAYVWTSQRTRQLTRQQTSRRTRKRTNPFFSKNMFNMPSLCFFTAYRFTWYSSRTRGTQTLPELVPRSDIRVPFVERRRYDVFPESQHKHIF